MMLPCCVEALRRQELLAQVHAVESVDSQDGTGGRQMRRRATVAPTKLPAMLWRGSRRMKVKSRISPCAGQRGGAGSVLRCWMLRWRRRGGELRRPCTWRFENRMSHSPPFGYYDAQAAGGRD